MRQAKESRYETMEYTYCGNSGLRLPRISLGLWHNFGSYASMENVREMCFTAFDRGITHFDLANNYGPAPGSAEENFGRLLRQEFAPYRDELIISTKAGYLMWDGPYGSGGSRKYLLASLDQSLRRMGLDYVDIFYHHCMDAHTPLEESMLALDTAVKSGKALYAGISNYDGPTAEKAAAILRELRCPFVINQNRYSILDRSIEQNGLKETAVQEGLGLIAFSPLAQGLLTGRYLNGIPADSRARYGGGYLDEARVQANLPKLRALQQIAVQRGETLAQMALKWVLKDGAVTSVLIGASGAQQIVEDIGMLSGAGFTAEELAAIDAAAAL